MMDEPLFLTLAQFCHMAHDRGMPVDEPLMSAAMGCWACGGPLHLFVEITPYGTAKLYAVERLDT